MKRSLRALVRSRAGQRCEYCCLHESDLALYAFHVEHIVAKKHAGEDNHSNLAWSCQSCNLAKGSNLSGRVLGQIVTLFHPRKQNWKRHFRWDGPILVGKTNCGRATIHVLNMNDDDRVRLRELLIALGTFPPS